jgi:hypothetical protein
LDGLLANGVISADEYLEWRKLQGADKMRHVISTLLTRHHPEAFIKLRRAIAKDATNHWLVTKLDKLCCIQRSEDEVTNVFEADMSKYQIGLVVNMCL